MPPSGSNSVHRAREALGGRLRELRRAAGYSGKAIAEALAWAPSKVSKLENGRQTPTDDDLRHWVRVTDHPETLDGLIASLHTLEEQYAEWQRQLRAGLTAPQRRLRDLDARTRVFRAFESTFVPGLLQTAEYARARFAQSVAVFGATDDIDEVVAARLQRQQILYRPDKRFHLVLSEAALRYRLCPRDVMLGQLDRLVSVTTQPNVRFGVIGFENTYRIAPAHGFWILDDDRVMVETFSAELNLAQPQEIALYRRVFDSLADSAGYGRAARAIIDRVIGDLESDS